MRIPSALYPTAPHHPSIVVAAPCAGQQGTCIQLPEEVFLQALVHKDVGRHKARPLQMLIIAIACIQLTEDVFLQAMVHKDVGRHKARPLQLLIFAIACIQLTEDVFLQALVHKDVGRHKARPLQMLIIAKGLCVKF